MGTNDREPRIEAARTVATAAGALLAGVHRLEAAVADPLHTRLREALAMLLPVCRALAESFPALRGQVAGLVYQSVEYRGFHGSSSLHVVTQIAELILGSGERWLQADTLSPKQLELLAEELGRALPSSLDGWLRNHLDTELSALERQLGVRVTDEFHRMDRPRALAHVERMISGFTRPPGKVVLAAGNSSSHVASQPPTLAVAFPSDKLAVVTEGTTTVELRGERRVWVFRHIVEAGGGVVTWQSLVKEDIRRAAERISTDDGSANPRMATSFESFQRTGNRIRDCLGKLAYHWHQDGHGARWDPEVS